MNNSENIYTCDVIQDLLPLYQDEVCSESSKKIIEAHLMECRDCSKIAEKLKNTNIDEQITAEKISILDSHAKKEKKRAFTVGLYASGVLMIPIIVCLICNLAIGHGLTWFFIVLSSLLVVASITVVPLMVEKKKGLWTLGSFVTSLILLFLIICIYTKGQWFFLATIPTVFGLSVVFSPFVIHSINLPKILSNKKGLLIMAWDTFWLYTLIFVCGLYSSSPNYWDYALKITTICVSLPWFIFIISRYLKASGFTKAGINLLAIGFFTTFIDRIISEILGDMQYATLNAVNFRIWNSYTIEANILLIILLSFVFISVIFLLIGLIQSLGKAKKQGENREKIGTK